MPRRTVSIFVLVCLFTGICIFMGSVFGNLLGEAGLFGGALIGGILGVLASIRMAIRPGWMEREAFGKAALTGTIAFLAAAAIAVTNMDGPVIPVLSIALVGLGVIAGREWHRRTRPTPVD